MGNKKGHKEAQNVSEMLTDMETAKSKALEPHRGQSIYKKASGDYQESKLKELVSLSIDEIATFATKEKVALDDLQEVQRRSIIYLKACEASGTFPSSLGLARSLGYSDRALRFWRSKKPKTPTAQWLEMFNEMCADIISQSALKNNSNPVMSIFLNKALYDFRETSEIVLTPNKQDIDGIDDISVDDIRKRYISTSNNDDE